MSAGTDSTTENSAISLPKGGGAISGLGETFSADPFTGAGAYAVPLAVPAGRLALAPQLALRYSSGSGNGPFGTGWQLSLPGVTRKTSRGIPRYLDDPGPGGAPADVFLLSGYEDLVRVSGAYPGRVRYRPRTEGLFARVEHVRDTTGDYWEVRSRDGLLTRYGTPVPAGAAAGWRDPATVADPGDPDRTFAWQVTVNQDPHGNLVRYEYLRDAGQEPGHRWDQPLISRISYADYGDPAAPSFLVTVDFDYEDRPDAFSAHRAGFEIRTTQRCRRIRVATHAADGVTRVSRDYHLTYEQASFSGASLLSRVDVTGVDEAGSATESLPPLSFDYSRFDPEGRRFTPVSGPGLPASVLSDPSFALVDLHGAGLPDVVQLGAVPRVWRNTGGGSFAMPSRLSSAPPVALGTPGVQLLDADGDGRPDLLISGARGGAVRGGAAGYFPMTFAGGWNSRSFRPYRASPSVSLADPAVKMIDLDGDGLTDVVRSGSRLESWFNDPDPRLAWTRTAVTNPDGPPVDLSDPSIRLADMTGDGLQDIVRIRSGNIAYWPNLGYGRWGRRVAMRNSPRLPDGYDPHQVLLGDVDGDGAADLVYVDQRQVLLWGNQSGNGWTGRPVVVAGTPVVTGTDAVQLADLHGSGMAGLLFARAADRSDRPYLRFLDFTGGVKPYLLTVMDNHLGAVTTVDYRPSTRDYLRDAADPDTRWRTTLPFPVHVVAKVTSADRFSGGRLTSEYLYHHGYWDGVEREFRGFAMVEHFDTETFTGTPDQHYSPPTLTRSWFHPGPVAAVEAGDWTELDLRGEYSAVDAPVLRRPVDQIALLAGLSRDERRVALRAMRGQLLRSELYALDGSERAARPWTVTENVVGVRREAPGVFFPLPIGQRTTQWERGTEPMTRISCPVTYDAYGFATAHLDVAVPRGRDPLSTGQPVLATYAVSEYARRDDPDRYLVDRISRVSTYEVVNDGSQDIDGLLAAVLAGAPVLSGDAGPVPPPSVGLRLLAHTRTYFDGADFTGLPLGRLGDHGLPARAETLAFTDGHLDTLYARAARPPYLVPGGTPAWTAEYPAEFRAAVPPLAGYLHYGDNDVAGSPGGFYVLSGRFAYDGRGLPVAKLDPFGARTGIDYDAHDLLAVRTTDPAGLVTRVDYDYRLLQPATTTDPNGNSHVVTYSPAGLVTAEFTRGKNGEGDRTAPGVRIDYDLLAVDERGRPASVRTTQRVHHDTQTGVPAGDIDAVQVSVQYSDGFGRVLQTRSQAEDTLFGDVTFGGGVLAVDQTVPAGDTAGRTRVATAADNVVVSGWQVYDNKGRTVQKYEPFLATGYDYGPPAEAQLGQRSTYFYDPRGQVVRTRNADGSEQRVVPGVPADLADPDHYTPTPWEAYTYDANDNAGRTDPGGTQAYAGHWNTPSSVELDALGRTVVAIARTGAERLVTTSAYDIRGHLVSVTDAAGRVAFRYAVDLAGRRWRIDGVDGGRTDGVPDAAGRPVETRDGRGALTLGTFDVLGRVSRVWARDDASAPVTLRQSVDYGDGGDPAQPAADRAAARARNVLSRVTRHRDEAGLTLIDLVDFRGNTLQATRRVIGDAPILATYDAARADGWRVTPFRVDWTPGPGQTQDQRDAALLDAAVYTTTSEYDALNRVTRHLFPVDVEGRRREVRQSYNRAGSLDQVHLDGTVYVQRIAYDAKGQRALVAYGNGVMTRYAYDPHTFRLARLRTEPYTLVGGTTYHPSGPVIQDYGYRHDLVGNVLGISDRTPGSGIVNNPAALTTSDPALRALLGRGDALDRAFGYDPVYRLTDATGREHQAPPPGAPWPGLTRGTDVTQAQPYQETYSYDAVGGLVRLVHAGSGGFTRAFTVDPAGNRLSRMTVGATAYDYTVDGSGNVTAEAGTRQFTWNHANQLSSFGTQTAGAEPSVHAQYLYDASGRRVKKLVRRQGGTVETTHYLDEVFEHHRWNTSASGANNHVHVMDDQQRVALVRIGPAEPGDGGPAVAFHLGDHLGSSAVVLDATGAVTNREEYSPYGETTFGSFSRKRYRYTGRERDEESGLGRHGHRYYSAWTARWMSVDPTGLAGGVNQYAYGAGGPLSHVDPSGTAPEKGPAADLKAAIREENAAGRSFEKNSELYQDAIARLNEAMASHGVEMSPEAFARSVAEVKTLEASLTQLRSRWDKAVEGLKKAQKVALKKLGAPETERIAQAENDALLTERIESLEPRFLKEPPPAGGPEPGPGKGGSPGRGGNGGGGGGGGRSGPVERGSGRGRGGSVRPGAVGAVGTGIRAAVGVAGALSLVDAAVDIGQDVAQGHIARAAGKATETAAVGVAFETPAAPVAAAYVVARVYWADRDNIDQAGGEAADRLVGRNHPYIGGTIAAGYAVGVSVGRAGVAVGQSVGRGAGHVAHAAGAVAHWIGSLFD